MTPLHDDNKIEEILDSYIKGITEYGSKLYEGHCVISAMKEYSTWYAQKVREETKVDENTSDGYHTFKELYEFRKLYNAALFNEYAKQGLYSAHKSYKHSDGEQCFGGGWFIVMATLPSGQISNHYENKDWDLFRCEERQIAEKWDGHTPQDVIDRLSALTTIKQ